MVATKQVKKTRHTCVILSMIGMIIRSALGLLFIIFGILVSSGSFVPNTSDMPYMSTSTIGSYLAITGLFFIVPSVILFLYWRSSEGEPTKQIISLPICAILFGGILNLVAGILALINNGNVDGTEIISSVPEDVGEGLTEIPGIIE